MLHDPWDATTVIEVGDGRYRAEIGDEWVLALVPQGGVVAAIAARAMATELHLGDAELQPLRTFNGVFVSPVPAGEVIVDVSVLRRGRSISQVQATVHGPGSETGFTALAVFGSPRPGFSFTELTFPEVPEPEGQPSFRDPLPPEAGEIERFSFRFWDEVLEGRPAMGLPFWDPTPRERAECASWYRFDRPPLGPDGRLDPLSAFVVADVMPGAVFEKVSPMESRWFAPSTDLTLHLFGAATPGWLLSHFRAHHAGDGYASVDAAVWDPRGPDGPELVAYATQEMFFTRMD